MPDANFLQIHSLHGYSAALLNRDDSGLAKRMIYGGAIRTRISSQCLKRHWRVASGPHSLQAIDGATAGVRSRETVTRRVIGPLAEAGHDPEAIKKIEGAFQRAVYGEKGEESRQPLLLGEPEIKYLATQAKKIADAFGSDTKAAEKASKEWEKGARANMKALRDSCTLPAGIAAALFGRMVTSDVEANLDAPVHVAHAFTVHGEESESDYFTVVDDLQGVEDEPGADHIGETELTSGLFYGYVVLDRKMLLNNLGGDARNRRCRCPTLGTPYRHRLTGCQARFDRPLWLCKLDVDRGRRLSATQSRRGFPRSVPALRRGGGTAGVHTPGPIRHGVRDRRISTRDEFA